MDTSDPPVPLGYSHLGGTDFLYPDLPSQLVSLGLIHSSPDSQALVGKGVLEALADRIAGPTNGLGPLAQRPHPAGLF